MENNELADHGISVLSNANPGEKIYRIDVIHTLTAILTGSDKLGYNTADLIEMAMDNWEKEHGKT